MPTRALLNLAYAAWTADLTPEGREALDETLLPHLDQLALARRERISVALEVPGAVVV